MIDHVNADPRLQGALGPFEAAGLVPVMTHTTVLTTGVPSVAQVCMLGGGQGGRREQ